MENFFMNWILPILFFFVLGQMIMHFMGNRFGGNAMSFGKSNAKIYMCRPRRVSPLKM
jgi:cell division protease FtsH